MWRLKFTWNQPMKLLEIESSQRRCKVVAEYLRHAAESESQKSSDSLRVRKFEVENE